MEPESMKVVCLIDFSLNARLAVERAAELVAGSEPHSELVLLHCMEETEDNVVNFLWSGGDLTKIEMINANLDESGQTLLNDYVSLAQKAGVKQISPIMIRSAKPPEALLNKLQELKPHVVVMGSTSKTAVVKQLLMGSTTKYIKEHITCTVVEVKDEYDPH